jgi:hypothetical protein
MSIDDALYAVDFTTDDGGQAGLADMIGVLAQAVKFHAHNVGFGGQGAPGTIEFLGMQIRDEIAPALSSIAAALYDVASAIREHK